MKRKKEILADILFNSYLVDFFKNLPGRNRLIVFNFHRIKPPGTSFATPFDDSVYTVDIGEFELQIKWLKRHTRILCENELLSCLKEGRLTPPDTSSPSVVITFDDGYRDNYNLAYPLLKSWEVPAILFIATEMINSRRLPWWDIIAYLIKECPKPDLFWDKRRFSLPAERGEAISFFQSEMKNKPYEHTKYLLAELAEACEVPFPPGEVQDREILSWEEIREMADGGIAIGSHTHTHRVLSTLEPVSQMEEMILSKIIIEEKLGRPVSTIAYPAGELRYISEETPHLAASAGYRIGFTTNSGVNVWRSANPLKVSRLADLVHRVSTLSFLTILPELFAWEKVELFQMQMKEKHPTYADICYRLGIAQLGKGSIARAIESFREAVEINPNYKEARIKLGISQIYGGDFEEAEKNFLFLLAKNPAFADVSYYLGIVYIGKGQIPEAIDCLRQAVSINPSYREAILKLALLYCLEGRYEAALETLLQASLLNPPDYDLRDFVKQAREIMAAHGPASAELAALLRYHSGGGKGEDLIPKFATHLDISPNLDDLVSFVEKEVFPEENIEALLRLFEDYLESFPRYPDIHLALGILLKKIGSPRKAEASFTEALRLNPGYVKARLQLFYLLKEQHRFREALEEGYKLEKINLPYPDFYLILTEICLSLDRGNEAGRYAEKALALSPGLSEAKRLRRLICDRIGAH